MSRDAGSLSPSNSYDVNSVTSGLTNDTMESSFVNSFKRVSAVSQRLQLNILAISHTRGKKEEISPNPCNAISNQLEYLAKVVKAAISHPAGFFFKVPVDYEGLNIPDYVHIVLRPMDLKTIQVKLQKKIYANAHECICDLNQMFTNCYLFNASAELVVNKALSLERFMKDKLQRMPWPETFSSVKGTSSTKKRLTAPFCDVREVSAPKFLCLDEQPVATNFTSHARNCLAVLTELQTKYPHLSFIFLEPVDVVKLNLSNYHDIIKHPMDMSTMRMKLTTGQYSQPSEFDTDFRLMIDNCIVYNGKASRFGKDALKLLSFYAAAYKRLVQCEPDLLAVSVPSLPPAPVLPPSSSMNDVPNRHPVSSSTILSRPNSMANTLPTAVNSHHPPAHSEPILAPQPPVKTEPSTKPIVSTLPNAPADIMNESPFTEEELEELETIYADMANMSEKSQELAFMVGEIQSRINLLCDRRPSTFGGLQKFLTVRGFDRLPDFFGQPGALLGPSRQNHGRPSGIVNGRAHSKERHHSGGDTKRKKSHGKSSKGVAHSVTSQTSFSKMSSHSPSNNLMNGVDHGNNCGSVLQSNEPVSRQHSNKLQQSPDQPRDSSSTTHNKEYEQDVNHKSSKRHHHQSHAISSSLPSQEVSIPSKSVTDNDEVTFEEKEELSRAINAMPQSHLVQVVHIIQKHESGFPRDPKSHDFEVDFEQLQTGTLRALQKYVKDVSADLSGSTFFEEKPPQERYRHSSGSSSDSDSNSTYASDSDTSSSASSISCPING